MTEFYEIFNQNKYRTADQALEALIEANKTMMAEELKLNDKDPFQISIGIGYGNVTWSKNDKIFGEEMNLASKLGEDIACGGKVLLTEVAYENISE